MQWSSSENARDKQEQESREENQLTLAIVTHSLISSQDDVNFARIGLPFGNVWTPNSFTLPHAIAFNEFVLLKERLTRCITKDISSDVSRNTAWPIANLDRRFSHIL